MIKALGLFLALALGASTGLARSANSIVAATAAAKPATAVLLVGNSLSYVNNLPALVNALAAQQADPPALHADLVGAPGGSIAERWQDGVAAAQINSGRWQVLVLQERGGVLACLGTPETRYQADCVASVSAHRQFAQLARAHGLRVIVLGTWGPDSIWQSQLSRGLRNLAKIIDAEALDAGPAVRAYAKAHPQTAMTSDATLHPTLDASLLVSALLYRQVSGQAPQARPLQLSAAMLPANARVDADRLLSTQAQLAGDGAITEIALARLQPLLDAASLQALSAPARPSPAR
jgi:hypothetical protein